MSEDDAPGGERREPSLEPGFLGDAADALAEEEELPAFLAARRSAPPPAGPPDEEGVADENAWRAFADADTGETPPVGASSSGRELFGGEPLPPALRLEPDLSMLPEEPPASSVPEARWRREAGDYEDDAWGEITAEFRALREEPEPAPPPPPEEGEAAPEEEPGPKPTSNASPAPAETRRGPSRDVALATMTGLGFGALALGLIKLGKPWFLTLATIVLLLSLAEFYAGARSAHYRPAAAPGLLGTLVVLVGTYRQGTEALGFGLAMVLVFTLLWFLLGVIRTHPVANLGITLLGVLYVGFLGSFAVQILGFPDWAGVTIAYLALAVASDVGAYAVGSRFGRVRVLPQVSPNKSLEGVIGGGVLALAVALVVVRPIHPFDAKSAIGLALVTMIGAPLGDLYESMVKRALGVKDLGQILPGHGGVLDRVDSILVVAPAVFYFTRWVVY